MSNSPNIVMPYLIASQSQKEVTHNDAINDIDCFLQLTVVDHLLNTPPASPNNGDAYIVGSSPTGAWTGYANYVVCYYSGWKFKQPRAGWRSWTKNGNKFLYFNGSIWASLSYPYLDGTFTWNPGTIVNGGGLTSSTVAISGAALGDFVKVSAPYDLQGAISAAYVSSANNVVVRLQNHTGGSLTFASGSWRVRISKT